MFQSMATATPVAETEWHQDSGATDLSIRRRSRLDPRRFAEPGPGEHSGDSCGLQLRSARRSQKRAVKVEILIHHRLCGKTFLSFAATNFGRNRICARDRAGHFLDSVDQEPGFSLAHNFRQRST